MLSDEEILYKLRKKENKAFKVIFDKFYFPLCLFAHNFVKDSSIIDDLVQESFVRLWQYAENFNHISAVKSFLYLCVKNSCINHIKHRSIEEKNNETIFLTQEQLDPDNPDYFEDELYARLYEVIHDLPNQSRRIILLSLAGKSNIEIADSLNISLNTVKTLKRRSYLTLRDQLGSIRWILIFIM